MGIKTSQADKFFSKCIRASNHYRCEKCNSQYDKSSSGLHCSHIFSRRHRTIRWCKDNAQSLCYRCHQWLGGNPADSGAWLVSVLGETHLEILRGKLNSKVKVTKLEEKDIASHYREQLKLIEQAIENGETGIIDFTSWQ